MRLIILRSLLPRRRVDGSYHIKVVVAGQES